MERYSKKLVVLIFTLIFLVVGLGTYIYIDKFILTEETTCDCSDDSLLKDKNKVIVYDNPNYKKLEIPYINIDSVDAGKLNTKLEEFYTKELKLSDKSNLDKVAMAYDYYSNSNYLSVICLYSSEGINYYKTANINFKTGKEVDPIDLLLAANFKREDFYNTIIDVYDKGIDQSQEFYVAPEPGDKTIYTMTIDSIKEKQIEDYEMYLNDNKELCVVIEEYEATGETTNRKVVNLSKAKYENVEKTE